MSEKVKTIDKEKLDVIWLQRSEKPIVSAYLSQEEFSGELFIPGKKEILLKRIVELINSAKNTICISSFIISERQIVDAVLSRSDVDIYILTSEIKFLQNMTKYEDINDEAIQSHAKMLNQLRQRARINTSAGNHSKFIVIDPHSDDTIKGLLFTSNLTGPALRKNPEIGISLNKDEAKLLFHQFCIGFWQDSTQTLKTAGRLAAKNHFDIKIPPLPESSSFLFTTKNQKNLMDRIIKLISSTTGDIKICSFGIDRDTEVFRLLLSELDKRNITIFIRDRPSNLETKGALIELKKKGAKIYSIPLMHAKAVYIEDKTGRKGIVMTANFEKNGLVEGFETGVYLENRRAKILSLLFREWEQIAPLELMVEVDKDSMKSSYILWDKDKFIRCNQKSDKEKPANESTISEQT